MSVIPVLVTGIHRAARSGACGFLDTGDKPSSVRLIVEEIQLFVERELLVCGLGVAEELI